MAIIPANWTGIQQVNAFSTTNLTNNDTPQQWKYSKNIKANFDSTENPIILIGYTKDLINRQIELVVIQGEISLYWINSDQSLTLISTFFENSIYQDVALNSMGLAISGLGEIQILVRWDTLSNFELYTGDELMIPVNIKLAVGTGNNFTDVNANSYDANEYQYLINLNKLKNSDSGVTGWKLFDVTCFYPGKPINFNVNIPNNTSYDLTSPIALQLFDPLTIGEVLFAVANDVVNLEINNLGDKFIGNLTRGAYYKEVINNSIEIIPDFSKHIGRFVAKNSFTGMYDTAIIESYTPNTDIYKGGTFTLTGKF